MNPTGSQAEDRARQIVEGLGEGFLGLDDDWRVTDCNVAARSFLDPADKDPRGLKVGDLSGLVTQGAFGDLARRVAHTGMAEEAEIAGPAGEAARLVEVRVFPLGPGVGATLRDITARRVAERELAEREAHYRELADGTPAAAWLSRADGELEFINQAMADALGRTREALLGEGWTAAIDPEDRAVMLEVREQARASHSAFHYEGRFRRADGALRIIELYGRPRFDASGTFQGHVGMATDVTERREAERRQALLIDELNHRVKNTLATVHSLVTHTLREAGMAGEVGGRVLGRLLALSAAHNVLNRTGWDAAELADVVEAVAKPYVDAQLDITAGGPRARLAANTVVTLAMALNELAANAARAGVLSARGGRVRISWAVSASGGVVLAWTERGGPSAPPAAEGLCARLLRQLKAELEPGPEGLVCRIRLRMEP